MAIDALAQDFIWHTPRRRVRAVASGGETNIPQFSSSITWYRFNEFTNSAGKHVDSSFIGTNTAVPTAGAASPTWVSAGQGIYLDGGDYSSQDVGYILNGLSEVTYSMWMSNKVFVLYAGVVFDRGASVHGIGLDDTSSELTSYPDHTRSFNRITNSVAWTNAGWVHICTTWANNEDPRTYVNGFLLANTTQTKGTNLVISGQTGVIRLGWDDFSAERKFNGNLDDVLIYNKKLASNEVFQLYQFGH
jgi:hypothetical protein